MNKQMTKLATLVGAALALTCGVAQAESQYGYNAAGTGALTATARVNITVTTPKLILLRVGGAAATTAEDVALTASLNGGIPAGAVVPVDGSSAVANWNGAAPTWGDTNAQAVTAYAWTNNQAGGKITSAVTTAFPAASGLTAASVVVTSSGALAHPANTGIAANIDITRNTAMSSTWTYSVPAATLAGVASGANSQVVTYTATTL